MSFHAVVIHYGPYDSFHTVAHKPQKLRGLKDRLQQLGFRVDLAPVEYRNYCVLEMGGHEVFRCNIQNLLFNTPYDRDPVCQRAIAACLDASNRLIKADTYLWIWTLIDDQMFRTSEYAPKDHWPHDTNKLKPFASCVDCIGCCDILVQKKIA